MIQREAPTEPPAALAAAELVYVRKGGQLQPLAQPYGGPYKVLERGPKYFRLDIGGRSTAVTVDRLKPQRQRGDNPGGAAEARTPATTAVPLAAHAGDGDSTVLTSNTSNVNGTVDTSPGSITRAPSHYRSSPCPPAQGSQQIRPLVRQEVWGE